MLNIIRRFKNDSFVQTTTRVAAPSGGKELIACKRLCVERNLYLSRQIDFERYQFILPKAFDFHTFMPLSLSLCEDKKLRWIS